MQLTACIAVTSFLDCNFLGKDELQPKEVQLSVRVKFQGEFPSPHVSSCKDIFKMVMISILR